MNYDAIKSYICANEWLLAKEALLNLHLNDRTNAKILGKLGDCCMKLSEYDLAKQCYSKCVHYSTTSNAARYCLKLAHICQIYNDPYSQKSDFEQLMEAQSLYEAVMQMNDISVKMRLKCCFNYAQLLTKMEQCNEARKYYQKLIEIMQQNALYDTNKQSAASIHYHYAQLLFGIDSATNQQNICHHFEIAIDLAPHCIKYQQKYADILQCFVDSNECESDNENWADYNYESPPPPPQSIQKHAKCQSEIEESISTSSQSQCDNEDEKNENIENGVDEIELFLVMTAQTDVHIAHKYLNIANGDLNIAINIYMEDIEKRELRKHAANKWKKNGKKQRCAQQQQKKNKKKRKKQKQKLQLSSPKMLKKINKQSGGNNGQNENEQKKNETLLPPIIFDRNGHNQIKKLSEIKMIVFDIGTLAYLHSFKANKKGNLKIHHTDTLYILDMFGGRDRIERLKEFFESIQQINIRMCIISNREKSSYIAEALRRVHLYKFFKNSQSFIAGKEIISQIKTSFKNKAKCEKKLIFVENMLIKKKLFNKNCLLIDNKFYEENQSQNICFSLVIDHGFDFLLECDFDKIAKTIGCKQKCIENELNYPLNRSLSQINFVLYKDVKFEIINNGKHYQGNNRHLLTKYIKYKCRNLSEPETRCFLYFFQKFKLLQDSLHSHKSWIVLNVCFELMNIETMDSDLCRCLAMALSEYQYFADAEFYFNKSLEIAPSNITTLKAFAYFLFMLERYDECSDIFEKALAINPISKKAMLGYARSLSFLREYERAEEYFKKCILYYSEWDLAHFRYGKFLYLRERYREAKIYLESAVQIWSHSARSHLFLAQCYNKLGDVEDFEYHLNEALKLEPEHHEAINKWERHYCKAYNASYFRKRKFVAQAPKLRPNKNWDGNVYDDEKNEDAQNGFAEDVSVWNNEFERFWFVYVWFNNDKKKNEYFVRFKKKHLNDIRLILNENDISTILRSQLGITSNNDIKYILNGIGKYKKENEEYKKWLNEVVKLKKEYHGIFEKNAIYTFGVLFNKIKNKFDLEQMFGKEQEMTVEYLWKCMVEKHQRLNHQQNGNQHQQNGYAHTQKPLQQQQQHQNNHYRNALSS